MQGCGKIENKQGSKGRSPLAEREVPSLPLLSLPQKAAIWDFVTALLENGWETYFGGKIKQ